MRDTELTDFFAGLAMMGLIAHPDSDAHKPTSTFAKIAYNVADAMMEERKRRDFEERTSC